MLGHATSSLETGRISITIKGFETDAVHSDRLGRSNDALPVWNGRNDKGNIVAAGVYYILLEKDGSIESKKRFGVVK